MTAVFLEPDENVEPIPFTIARGGRCLVLDLQLHNGRDIGFCSAGGLPVHDHKSSHLLRWPLRLAGRSSCLEAPESQFMVNIYNQGAIHSSGLERPQDTVAALCIIGSWETRVWPALP